MTMSFGLKSLRSRIYYFVWDSALESLPGTEASGGDVVGGKMFSFNWNLNFMIPSFFPFPSPAPYTRSHTPISLHTNSSRDRIFFFCEKSFPFTLGRIFLFFIFAFFHRECLHFFSSTSNLHRRRLSSSSCFDKWFCSMDSRLLLRVALNSFNGKERRLLTLWKWKVVGDFLSRSLNVEDTWKYFSVEIRHFSTLEFQFILLLFLALISIFAQFSHKNSHFLSR